MTNLKVTEDEKELILMLRNYRAAYPNANWFLEIEIDELLDKLKNPNY